MLFWRLLSDCRLPFSTFPCTDSYRKRLVENVTSVAMSDENFLYFCSPHSSWNPSCCHALKLVFNDISILYSNSLSTVPKEKRSSPAEVREMRKYKRRFKTCQEEIKGHKLRHKEPGRKLDKRVQGRPKKTGTKILKATSKKLPPKIFKATSFCNVNTSISNKEGWKQLEKYTFMAILSQSSSMYYCCQLPKLYRALLWIWKC